MRFNREHAVWRDKQVPFSARLLAAGFIYKNTVTISIVENGKPRDVTGAAEMFEIGLLTPRLQEGPLVLSGFRVLSHLNSRTVWRGPLVRS
jgi:periplasmic glucans biosynthesis protein